MYLSLNSDIVNIDNALTWKKLGDGHNKTAIPSGAREVYVTVMLKSTTNYRKHTFYLTGSDCSNSLYALFESGGYDSSCTIINEKGYIRVYQSKMWNTLVPISDCTFYIYYR